MSVTFTKSGAVLRENGVDTKSPYDILSWMGEVVRIEDGITFFELIRCLSPWSEATARIARCNFDILLAEAAKPFDSASLPESERISRVEIRPFIEVFRDEETKAAEVTISWEPFGVLEEPAVYDGIICEVVGLELSHPSKYAHVPIVIVNEAKVSDVMTGGKTAPWNMEPAIHPTVDGGVTSFFAVPTVIATLLYGLIDEVTAAGTPDEAAAKVAYIVEELERHA